MHLSPTSLLLYQENPEDWYMKYMAPVRPPRIPQNQPMSIGSSFDAYVKSFLHENIYGKGSDPRFELATLFEAQVEPQNRDWAWRHGAVCFQQYREAGALADLLLQLKKADNPRFELEVKGEVRRGMDGVDLLGKPDILFKSASGRAVNFDFKVNGWCAKSPKSPMPGYVMLRSPDPSDRTANKAHKAAKLECVDGIYINVATTLDKLDQKWGLQLAVYSWLCGEEIGSNTIVGIEQIVCKPTGCEFPKIRVANHRLQIDPAFQEQTFKEFVDLSNAIKTGHFFPELTKEENDKRVEELNRKSQILDKWQDNPAMLQAFGRG